MSYSVKLTGVEAWLTKLEGRKNAMLTEIDAEMMASCQNIAGNAKEDCPANGGQLQNSIEAKDNGFLKKEIGAYLFYAPYVEFGTGEYAAAYVSSLPDELQAYAMTFYVNGKGRMPAAPFLYPNFVREQTVLIENIKAVLKRG